jgi:hypothetical protein
MNPIIPEKNKKDGVCYAVTDDGLELPVIDITHPAFSFSITDAELDALIGSMQRSSSLPPAVLQSVAQQSILFRGLAESAGTFTTGMMTYLNKLEPENLGDGYATAVDRQWAASLTPVTFRWRMRHVARLLADGLAPALSQRKTAPVHLINIAGGPAMDSLNALILLQKEQPGLLAGRVISLHVLDLDTEGPSFGGRALAALQEPGAPLDGLSVRFAAIQYDWTDTSPLQSLVAQLEPEAAVAGSSEGGLFEYASDAAIVANLQVLRTGTPADMRMVGPVVRDASTLDPRLKGTEHVPGRPAVRYIGLEAFGKLAHLAGWTIAQTLDGPMHQVVSLKKV